MKQKESEELRIESDFFYEGVRNIGGFACSSIYGSAGLSFYQSHDKSWLMDDIKLNKVSIEEEDEIVSFPHFSQLKHINTHSLFFRRVASPIQNFDALLQFSENEEGYKVEWKECAKKEMMSKVNQNSEYLNRVYLLIKSMKITPFSGEGKPEILKHDKAGSLSRRITQEHRLIYKVLDNKHIEISECFGHYDN